MASPPLTMTSDATSPARPMVNNAAVANVNSAYRTLRSNEVRVLDLEAGIPPDPLRGAFAYVRLHENVWKQSTYEAISYAWGDADLCHTIELHGSGHLSITRSLYVALQALRSADVTRHLWADQICINQSDALERAAQVMLMGRIYGAAQKVIVWVGEAVNTDALAFTAIKLAGSFEDFEDLGKAVQEAGGCSCCNSCFDLRDVSHEHAAQAAVKALGLVLRRPWFTRLWVVQEIARAVEAEVICGSHRTSWYDLVLALSALDPPPEEEPTRPSNGDIAPDRLISTAQMAQMIHARDSLLAELTSVGGQCTADYVCDKLLDLLIAFSDRQCSDPRDRVWALLGLSLPLRDSLFKPQYTMSVCAVYAAAVATLIRAPPLDHKAPVPRLALMLALKGTEYPRGEHGDRHDAKGQWISWVPDFHALTIHSKRKYELYKNWAQKEKQAGRKGSQQIPNVTITDRLLSTPGRRFATIESVLDASACPAMAFPSLGKRTSDEKDGALLRELLEWYIRCITFLAEFFDQKEANAIKDEVFRSGHEHHQDQDPADYSCFISRAREAALIDPLLLKVSNFNGGSMLIVWKSLRLFFASEAHPTYDFTRNLAIVRGPKGRRAAWVPTTCRPGDEICALKSAPFPIAVRMKKRMFAKRIYRVLGDAWIHDWNERDSDNWLGKKAFKTIMFA